MQTHLVNKEQQKTEKYLAPDLSRLLGELVASTQLVMTSEPRQVQPSAGGLACTRSVPTAYSHARHAWTSLPLEGTSDFTHVR